MIKIHKIALAAGIVLLAFLAWYFSTIVSYICIAAIVSFIGQPMVTRLNSIHIRKRKLPPVVSTLITLFLLLLVITLFILLFVPLIAHEAKVLSAIDYNKMLEDIQVPLARLEMMLNDYGILAHGETLQSALKTQLRSIIDVATFSDFFGQIISFTGSFFVGLFSVLFISFFFLKDEHLFYKGIMLLVPLKYKEQTSRVLDETKHLLSRYFTGLIIELISVIALLSIGLSILGVKNALIMAFFGGIMNIIPYVGPVIGTSVGVILGVAGSLDSGLTTDLLWLTLFIIAVFGITNSIDGMLLQPFIFSNSVKAHPLEIFLVILVAGSVSGIVGMIIAIPVYTVIRIVAREFFSRFRIVKQLTDKM
ncbi:MAG: AI-2E family transporter [Lentimicrobiaceae bacterium]|nr:AI-2E family transporter [Lentimicrobiaceae bacterium]